MAACGLAVAMTPSDSSRAETSFCPPGRRRDVLFAAILASSMGFIDGSIVAIATPAMRADLGASLTAIQWVSSAYLLFLSAFVLTGGALGDRFGLRNVFAAGIAAFVAASGLCAWAGDPETLIGARALQGLAAAVMVPGSLAIIAKAYPPADRAGAIGLWAAASAATAALGPLIGGAAIAFLGDAGWRLVFALNLPFGAAALWLLLRAPADRADPDKALDIAGAAIATAALGLIAFGLTGGFVPADPRGAAPPPDLVVTGVGVVLLGGFVLREAVARQPMLPLGLFAAGGFAGANLATLLLYFALSGSLFFLPMTLVTAWGVGEAQAALVFAPISVIVGVMSGPVGRQAGPTGPRPWLVAGSLVCAAGYAAMAATMPLMAFWTALTPAMAVVGLGMGLLVSPLSTAVMTGVGETQTGVASAVNNTVARMASLLAVASLGGLVSAVFDAWAGAPGLAFGEAPGPGVAADIAARWIAASNAAYGAVAWICAGLCLAAAAVSRLMIPAGRG